MDENSTNKNDSDCNYTLKSQSIAKLKCRLIMLLISSSSIVLFYLINSCLTFSLINRLRLPTPMIDRSQISIWSILKSNIGKVS